MLIQPGAGFQAVVTGEVIGDDKDVPGRIVSFTVGERGNVDVSVWG